MASVKPDPAVLKSSGGPCQVVYISKALHLQITMSMRVPQLTLTTAIITGLGTIPSIAQEFSPLNSGSQKLFAMPSGPSNGYSIAFDSVHVENGSTSY